MRVLCCTEQVLIWKWLWTNHFPGASIRYATSVMEGLHHLVKSRGNPLDLVQVDMFLPVLPGHQPTAPIHGTTDPIRQAIWEEGMDIPILVVADPHWACQFAHWTPIPLDGEHGSYNVERWRDCVLRLVSQPLIIP